MERGDPSHNWKPSKQTSKEMSKAVKSEKDAGLNTALFSPENYPGSKSRQQLTEDEKEARWLRRVLANRESARETIRRRQAMLAELTRKSVDLELENENLKREREKAAHEYSLLKSTNDGLKAQIDEMIQDEEMAMKEKSRPHNAECLEMLRPENGVATLVPMSQMWMPNTEQMNSVMFANPGTFLYVVPCPFLYPCYAPPFNTLLPQTSELSDGQCQTSLVHQFDASCPSKTTTQEDNGESSFPLKSKPEAGGGVFPAAPMSCVRPIARKRPFTSLHQGECSNSVAVDSVVCATTDVMSEKKSEELKLSPNNKTAEAVAATKARKRRKELTRLKNIQNCTF